MPNINMLQAYEYDAILRMCATYDGKVDKMMEVAMIAMCLICQIYNYVLSD